MHVQDLDHLGLIAGIIDQIGLPQRINDCLGTHPQQIVSPGQGVKAMIINALGFVTAPLYLYENFFDGKATSHLLGKGIESKHLNDDYLGRLLDKIWDYGSSQLFSLVAMDAYRLCDLETSRYHLDSSSISVYGAYDVQEDTSGGLEITYGYSKDHRPDLKQFLVEMICCNDGDIPLAFGVANGNQSDKAVFAQRLKAFAQEWQLDGMLVADSALYTQENLLELGELHWLTRVPLTLTEAQNLVTELSSEAFCESQIEGYRLSSLCSTYGGIKQQWIVVENQARVETDSQQIDKQVEKQEKQAHKQWRRQSKIEFNCAEDAYNQGLALSTTWRYHTLEELEVVEKLHYDQSGRPKKGTQPSQITYRLQGKVVSEQTVIEKAKRKAGRFILATNVVDNSEVNAQTILQDYKGQQSAERGFGLLKDPLFFTSSVFLKTPERIGALAIIMGLSLMVYTIAQRQLRQSLVEANENVSDQRRCPTQTPTMRWIYQCFQAIHLVWLNGQTKISNLTPERLKILSLFGTPCQKYYLIC